MAWRAIIACGLILSGFLAFLGYATIAGLSERTAFPGWFETLRMQVFMAPCGLLPMGAVVGIALVAQEVQHRRWRARHSDRRCPSCGYQSGLARCPECGRTVEQSMPRRISVKGLGAIAALWLGAVLVGESCAELLVALDEAKFRREVDAYVTGGGTGVFGRARAWPNRNCSLVYVQGRGIHATD